MSRSRRSDAASADAVASAVEDVFTEAFRDFVEWQEATDGRAELLARLAGAPGAELAAVLDEVVLADADEFVLGEVLCATERLASWAMAHQLEVVSEMRRRAGAHPEWVRDGVAALLTVSGRAADVVVERALVTDAVPELHDALASGAIDARRVDVVARETRHLTTEETRDLVVDVLPGASDMTGPRLRTALRRADAARTPDVTERRAEVARRDRCVQLEHAPDTMAWIHALLPAADAMAVWSAVDALAHHPAEADGRTLAQRRADALTGVMRGILDQGEHPDGTPLARAHGRRPHLSVVVRPELLEPGAVGTAELEGYGPVPASIAREIAAEAEWHVVTADPETGECRGMSTAAYRPSAALARAVLGRDRTCTYPGCDRPALRCDLDHIVPFDPDRPAAEQTHEDNLHALCRRHHGMKTRGGWKVERDADTGVTTWTAPDGHRFTRAPDPIDPSVLAPPARPAGPRRDPPPDDDAPSAPDDPGPPPF